MGMKIDFLDISIHQHNACGITLTLTGDDIPEDGTKVLFLVKRTPDYVNPVISKELTVHDSQIDINFSKEDTSLPTGTYYWNACIQYSDGREPWTLLDDAAKLIILPEIGLA